MQGIENSEFKLRLGADPTDPGLAMAAAELGADAQLRLRQALAFEKALGQALAVPVPERLLARLNELPQREDPRTAHWFGRGGWLALAASLLLTIGLIGNWYTATNSDLPRAGAVAVASVEHLVHEPFALLRTEAVDSAKVQQLLSNAGLQLAQPLTVQYAMPCPVAGQTTVHMVVQQPSGPVSVLFFPAADPATIGDFHVGTTRGRAIAFDKGMLVLMASDADSLGVVQAMYQVALAANASSEVLIAANLP